MNTEELCERLTTEGYDRRFFSRDRNSPPLVEGYVLEKVGARWTVFSLSAEAFATSQILRANMMLVTSCMRGLFQPTALL
jgi:hypothetical protein